MKKKYKKNKNILNNMFRPNIELNNDLEFQALDWIGNDINEENEMKYIIKVYGCTKSGNSVCIHIKGYNPYFYVKFEEEWGNKEMVRMINNIQREKEKKNKKMNIEDEWGIHKKMNNELISSTIIKSKDFYDGFNNGKLYKFVKLEFKNYIGFCIYRKILENMKDEKGNKYELYESNIVPYLRYIHMKNISPANWIIIKKGKYHEVDEKQTRCQIEMYANYNDINGLIVADSAPFIIASFDIECTSKDGSFPQEERKDDRIIQIGTTVHKYGMKECNLHYIGTLKKVEPIKKEEIGAKEIIIESYEKEDELIIGWCKFINKLDPDILTGYNIWGFDMKYIYSRSRTGNGGDINPYDELILKIINRNKKNPAKYEIKQLSSSALGDNSLKYINIEGIIGIDLMKIIQREYKLASYKLDDVSNEIMKESKIDLAPRKIFENYNKGTPEKIKEIAIYCLKDCELINKLIMKIEVLANNIGMANVCNVPLSYLFLRGQGIKIFSLVLKQCNEENTLIKVINNDNDEETSYEGAIVFTPKPGIYMDPIGVDDFGSLYPSSMISENISHDSLVWVKKYDNNNNLISKVGNDKYDNLPEYNYNDIEYDNYQEIKEIDKNGKKKKKGIKTKIGYTVCRYAESKTGDKNILPRILQKLLQARKDTRKKIEMRSIKYKCNGENKEYYGSVEKNDRGYQISKEKIISKEDIIEVIDEYNEFQKKILDGLQLAYKITANSLYGQVGASTSPICKKELAASTTAVGRKMVCIARDMVLKKYPGSKLAYGDSVSADTPILCRLNNKIFYKTIENLEYEGEYEEENKEGKKYYKPIRGLEVWSDKGFTIIKSIMKHKMDPKKKMYKIETDSGKVEVTSDHSLLLEDGKIIKPKELKIGDKIMHADLPKIELINDEKINKDSKIYIAIKKYKELCEKKEIYNNKIISIKEINYEGYVYDLETENHHFSAGIGRIVVHNTDSIFVNYMGYINEKHGNNLTEYQKLEYTAKYSMEGAEYITSQLKPPQTLNFEKILYPFIIFAKKRYVGNKYENSIVKFKQINMGVVLKRRDNAKIVKEIFGNIINIILNEKEIEKSKEYYKQAIIDLLNGNVDINKLIITKSLKGNYVNPTQIAHKVLADRIGDRDPGNRPLSCDRIPYCYIESNNIKCIKCNEKINQEKCKCIKCMKIYCVKHLYNHKIECTIVCRYCKKQNNIKECNTCKGWYCMEDLIKHYGRCTDKCESINNICIICNKKNISEKCNICGCYICKNHNHNHNKCRDCNINEKIDICKICKVSFCEIHMYKHPNRCKKELQTKLLQGDLIEHPQYILENKYKIDYRYYLDHQIKVPTLQIFSLVMNHPESLISAAIRKDDNIKNSNTELTKWFTIINNENKDENKDKNKDENINNEENIEENFIEIENEIDILDNNE